MRIVVGKPANFWMNSSQEFTEHREVYSNLIRVLIERNFEFEIYEDRPHREQKIARRPNDGPRYVYHAYGLDFGDYCLKRGPLPYLWYFDREGYSGWCELAGSEELQQLGRNFDHGKTQN